jgi:hypothetical protein
VTVFLRDNDGVDEKRRYSVRPGAVALTRAQWITFGVVVTVAVVGGTLLAVTGDVAMGGVVLASGSLTGISILAFGRR